MYNAGRNGLATPSNMSRYHGSQFTGRTYGDDILCPICSQRHPVSEGSRAKMLCWRIAGELGQAANGLAPMMIGVLVANNGNVYAACSPADSQPGQLAFVQACQRVGMVPFIQCGNVPARGVATAGGRQMSPSEMARCRPTQQDPIQGRCAAPKMIHIALSQRAPRPWTMSEMLWDPAGQNAQYTPLWHAQSCNTCQRLLPRMLCKSNSEDVSLITVGFMRDQFNNPY